MVIAKPSLRAPAAAADLARPVRVDVADDLVEDLQADRLLRPPRGADRRCPRRRGSRPAPATSRRRSAGRSAGRRTRASGASLARPLDGARGRVAADPVVLARRRAASCTKPLPGRGPDRLLGRGLSGRVGEGDRRAEQEGEGQSPVDGGAGGHARDRDTTRRDEPPAPPGAARQHRLAGGGGGGDRRDRAVPARHRAAAGRGRDDGRARGSRPRGWKASSATPAREAVG